MPGDSAYIESHRDDGHNYGCSFIEFDGKGGFLGYDQFENALKVLDTRKAQSDVLLVIYCHGWMNNAQSGDVLHASTRAANTRYAGRLGVRPSSTSPHRQDRRGGNFLTWRTDQL